jgi:addiction module RelE/StbE family toxin
MVKVTWAPSAVTDIHNIAEYIAKDSLQSAYAQVDLFFEKVTVLERFPMYGKKVPELNDESFREILVGRYRIIYEVLSSDEIGIVTVHHQSRLLNNNQGIKNMLRRQKRRKK